MPLTLGEDVLVFCEDSAAWLPGRICAFPRRLGGCHFYTVEVADEGRRLTEVPATMLRRAFHEDDVARVFRVDRGWVPVIVGSSEDTQLARAAPQSARSPGGLTGAAESPWAMVPLREPHVEGVCELVPSYLLRRLHQTAGGSWW